MELHTKRLKVIPCTEELLETISEEDYKIGPHIKFYINELKADPSQFGWGVWLVIEKESNSIIGDIGFKGKPDSNHTVEVGYGIKPSSQNKGYATEAVKEIIKWAFTFDCVDKIVAECYEDNLSSIKVLEKLNMKRVGQCESMLKWELNKR